MIMLRIVAFIFFTIVTALHAEEHITPAQQTKARRISVFSFYAALTTGLISAGAHIYASAALRMARELHNLKKARDEISNYAMVELIKWSAVTLAVFFTINAILHLKDAYYTKIIQPTIVTANINH